MYKLSLISLLLATGVFAKEPATQPAVDPDNAVTFYLAAQQLVKVDCPSATNLEYPEYPPYSEEWHRMENAAYEQNRAALQLVRQARNVNEAAWPAGQKHLNDCRNLANQIGDAAIFEHLQGDHAAAVESIRDLLHMVDLLNMEQTDLIEPLVAAGVQALAAQRMLIITSAIGLTSDPNNKRDIQAADAQKLIQELLDFKEPLPVLAGVLGQEKARRGVSIETDRIIDLLNRSNTERTFAAVSLACHLYYFENSHWPATLDDLTPKYLERVPLDTFGDGRETLGYVIIKDGLPAGGDRPLVYSRCRSQDGLFYRVDAPQYGFYSGDGTSRPAREQKQGGQFRDIARWAPTPGVQVEPTTQPLP